MFYGFFSSSSISWTSGSSPNSVVTSNGSLLSKTSLYSWKLCNIYSWTNGSTQAMKNAPRNDVVTMGTTPVTRGSAPLMNIMLSTHNVPNARKKSTMDATKLPNFLRITKSPIRKETIVVRRLIMIKEPNET